MSSAEENSLWFGSDMEGNFYSAQALAYMISEYNNKLLEICLENQDVLCLDLEKKVPKNMSFFYDDVHFNEGGAEKVAYELHDYIRENIMLFKY